jgi:hypothetical protein
MRAERLVLALAALAASMGPATLSAQESVVRIADEWTWAAIPESSSIQAAPTQFAEPRERSGNVIAMQVVGGTFGAFLGGAVGGALLDSGGSGEAAMYGFALGSAVGATVSVYSIGQGAGVRGNVVGTSLLPLLATVPVFLHADDEMIGFYALLMLPLQAIGGTIGFGFAQPGK